MDSFHSVFLALRHPEEGWVLVDTGYGANFDAATRRLPSRLYRWASRAHNAVSTSRLLERAGIKCADIRHVIITHFHADHCGGLSEFPHAQIHYHSEALRPLANLQPLVQTWNAFLPALIPEWLSEKSALVSRTAFGVSADLPFDTYDLFGDQSIRLVDLPGHAPGQVGVAFESSRGRELFAADAFWRLSQLIDSKDPLYPAMAFQWDRFAYHTTLSQIRRLHANGQFRLSSCHDLNAKSLFDPISEK